MPIFELTTNELKPIAETKFGTEGLLERKDLQRLLRQQIDVIGDDLMVIAEEFGEWLDSARRIDLLCLDTDANLVVVELKRTEDGGHMELQALRYAAMVSTMTFEQLVEAHARYLNKAAPDKPADTDAAKAAILAFLGWGSVDEGQFAQDTRIVLAAADFGKELTTAVLWLLDRNIDIRCVRLKPYRMEGGTLLVDVQQIIPLPETASFQTQIGVKNQAERQNRADRFGLRFKFWEGLLACARTRTSTHATRKPKEGGSIFASLGRQGFSIGYRIRELNAQVAVWIDHGGQAQLNKQAFRALETLKADIERDFGADLNWEPMEGNVGCRVRYVVDGGYKSPAEQWPDIHVRLTDAMVRLDKAMRQRIATLKY